MFLSKLKVLAPHAIVVLLFILISMAYFSPLLEGKKLKQHDISMFIGMSKEIVDYRAKTGNEALWTNSMFGGMPAYQISVVFKNNIASYFNRYISLGIPAPASYLFLSLLGFYILLLCFKNDPWLSFAGALAFGFSTYFFIIEVAGHDSKAHAMALMAPVIAGFVLAFRGKYLLGGALTALFFALQLNANHLQITYYLFFILLIFGIVQFIITVKNKEWLKFSKASAILLVGILLAIGTNFTNIYLTYEYGKYSTRGASELTAKSNNQTSGLDRSYILNDYSYGIGETFNLFIPNIMGGSSSGAVGKNSATYKWFKDANYPEAEAQKYLKQLPLYWGDQRYTAGPVYIGAIAVFLFILGLFVVKGPIKWWLASVTLLSILLAWGKNFEFFSNFFIDYFPGYNKFRTVSMTLVIAELTIPLLGIIALWKMFSEEIDKAQKMKSLMWATGIAGGFALIFWVVPGIFFNFVAGYDSQLGWPETLVSALQADRESLLRSDAFRSLIFVLLSAGIIWAVIKNKTSVKIASVLFAILFLVDLGVVGKRFLKRENYASKIEAKVPFSPTQADLAILEDKDPDYRVLSLVESTFNDARTSYFHKSIGGYHGAKLKRFQEVAENQLGFEIDNLTRSFGSIKTEVQLDSALAQLTVLNLLNTRYIIVNPNSNPVRNKFALGNAWFVGSVKWMENANDEIKALSSVNPHKEMLVDQRFKSKIGDYIVSIDSAASIQLQTYEPNHLTYRSVTSSPQLAVFSEIYYDKGWNAYIDGKLSDYFRANYLLRAMKIPAGEHVIEFKFEPKAYAIGSNVALASSILMVLLIIGGLGLEIKNTLKKE
jgi:hypothetical protein